MFHLGHTVMKKIENFDIKIVHYRQFNNLTHYATETFLSPQDNTFDYTFYISMYMMYMQIVSLVFYFMQVVHALLAACLKSSIFNSCTQR